MSTTNKAIVFLALTFAISWGVALGAHFSGLRESLGPVLVLSGMMAGPAIAALICAFAFENGRRLEALGLRIKLNWWLLLAWLIPLALAAVSVVASVLLAPSMNLVDYGDVVIASVAAQAPEQAEQMRTVPYLGIMLICGSAIVGALLNAPILTLTEELGWRGYLHDLWRPSGFWRTSLGTGAVWGFWHAPAIWLYGLNYPDNAAIGIPTFVVWCMLLSPIMTLVRDRGGSVWAAGLFHGTINAVGGITVGVLSAPAFPWSGIVGIGGFVALVLGVLLVVLLKQKEAPAAI
jgi:uncharacterized protein